MYGDLYKTSFHFKNKIYVYHTWFINMTLKTLKQFPGFCLQKCISTQIGLF